MLGQASAIKVRNQVSEYPPLSKSAGCFFMYHGTGCKDTNYFWYTDHRGRFFLIIKGHSQWSKMWSKRTVPGDLCPSRRGWRKATGRRTQFGNRRCFYLSCNIGVVLLNEQDKSFFVLIVFPCNFFASYLLYNRKKWLSLYREIEFEQRKMEKSLPLGFSKSVFMCIIGVWRKENKHLRRCSDSITGRCIGWRPCFCTMMQRARTLCMMSSLSCLPHQLGCMRIRQQRFYSPVCATDVWTWYVAGRFRNESKGSTSSTSIPPLSRQTYFVKRRKP